jgi:hypothetical protein
MLSVVSAYNTYEFEDELPNEDFNDKRQLGRAKKKHNFGLNTMGGLSNSLLAYSISYGKIINAGESEFTLTLTYWETSDKPVENGSSKSILQVIDSKNVLLGFGVKYGSFFINLDEGFYYGGGLRVNLWETSYTRTNPKKPQKVKYRFQYQNIIPLLEIGYKYKFSVDWGLNFSAEGGWSLSTFDEANNLEAKGAITNVPPGDDERHPLFSENTYFWTVNIGVFVSI